MTVEQAPRHPLVAALVEELGRTLTALTGAEVSLQATAATGNPEWAVIVNVGDPWHGLLSVGFRRSDCIRLVQTVVGDQSEPDDAAIGDFLKELIGQAVGGVRERPEGRGALFCIEAPSPPALLPKADLSVFTASLNDTLSPFVYVNAQFETQTASATASAPSLMSVVSRDGISSGASASPNLDVILDIDLPLSVRFGRTEMTLETLMRLGPGSVIDLGRSPDDPVEVLVNGRLIARAEVVVVGGNYGVRILEVVSAADRVRTLTA